MRMLSCQLGGEKAEYDRQGVKHKRLMQTLGGHTNPAHSDCLSVVGFWVALVLTPCMFSQLFVRSTYYLYGQNLTLFSNKSEGNTQHNPAHTCLCQPRGKWPAAFSA